MEAIFAPTTPPFPSIKIFGFPAITDPSFASM